MKKNTQISAAAAALLFIVLPSLHAATNNWANAGTGNWAASSNWSPASVPGAADLVRINNGGTAQVTNSQSADILDIAAGAGFSGSVQVLSGGSLTVVTGGTVGAVTSSGSLLIRGGTMSVTTSSGGSLFAGRLSGAQGTVTISDGGSLTLNAQLSLGSQGGFGTLRIGEGAAPGTLSASYVGGGALGSGSGEVIFNHNATNYIFGTQLGGGGTGEALTIIHDGPGTTTLTASNSYTNGTTLNAGVLAVSQNANLGGAAGTLTFNGGTLRTTAGFTMNRATTINSNGAFFDVAAGMLTQQGVITGAGKLTKQGTGTLTLTASNSYTGGTDIQNGTLAVNSGGSINHGSAAMDVGSVSGQTGTLSIGAGSGVTSHRGRVGDGGTGIVNVGGAGATWTVTENLYVGNLSTGSLSVTAGGAVDVTGALRIGNNPGLTGTLTLNGSGSTLSVGTTAGVGRGGTGVLNIEEGAALTVNGGAGAVQLAEDPSSSGTLNIGTGGAVGTVNATRVFADPGSGKTAVVNFNHTGTTTFAPRLEGILSVNKLGTGTTTLTGSNNYNGATTISAGTLALGGAGSISNSSVVNVGATGTFDISGLSAMTGTVKGLSGSGLVQLGGKTLAVNVASNSTFAGTITGVGGRFTKLGAGTFTLTGSNNYPLDTKVKGGTLAVSGASAKILMTGGEFFVGETSGDNGTLRITDGALVTGSSGYIGHDGGATGAAIVSGATWSNGGLLQVGRTGSGSLLIESNGVVSSLVGTIASQLGSTGTATVTSGIWSNSVNFFVGSSGTGDLLVNGGQVANVDGFIGSSATGVGRATVSSGSWSNSGKLTVGMFGAGTLTITGGTVASGTTAVGENVTSSGALLLNGGVLRTGGVNAGAGAASFSIDGGTLRASANNTNFVSGFTSGVTLGAGGAFIDTDGFAVTVSSELTGAGGLTKRGAGTLTLTASNSYLSFDGTKVEQGTLAIGSGGSIYQGNATNPLIFIGTVSNQTGTLSIGAGGTVTGAADIGAGGTGVGRVSGAGASWTAGVLRVGASSLGSLQVDSGGEMVTGFLNVAATTGVTGLVTVNGTNSTLHSSFAIIGNSGIGTLTLEDGGTAVIDSGNGDLQLGRNLGEGTLNIGSGGLAGNLNAVAVKSGFNGSGVVNFNHTGSVTFAQRVEDLLSVNKLGAGTTTLTGSNNYTGATVIEAGTLLVNGINSGTNTVTVKSGGALGGTGSIAGAVTVEDGGILAPGASAGTLSVGSLILNSASELKFELGTSSDLVMVAGNLTLAGILNVTELTGFGAGSYTLFEYGGTLTDNGLAFGLMPTGFLYAIDLSDAGYVKLTVAPPDMYWDGPNTTPTGTVNGGTGTWNNTSSNWTSVNGLTNYIWNEMATAHFTATPGTVTVGETVDVAEMSFETNGYVLTGPGEIAINGPTLTVNTATNVTAEIGAVISGAGGLVKNGDEGTLILSADNTYTGDTLIAGGTLRVGNGGTTGSILGNVTNNGTLDFNRAGSLTFGGVISGTGDLKVTGTGTVTLTASNSYAGGTSLDNGTLLVADDSALGTGTLHLGDGTTFGVVPAGDVVLGNDVVINGDVNITSDFLSFLDFTGSVDLGTATRTLTFTENGSSVCFMGAISGDGGLSLGMASGGMSGVVTFCGSESNTYAGLTTVGSDVELSLEKDPGVTALAGDVQVDLGGSLSLVDASEQIHPDSTVTINGILGILAISGTTTQTIGNLQGTGAIINIFGPSTLTVKSGSFSGSIMDSGADPLALVKNTAGTLTLSGANDYRGGTKITAGTLRTLDPSALGSGSVELSGGTLAPGGTLNIAALDWTGGTVALSLGTATDFLGITGNLTLDSGGGLFDFTDGTGFVPNTVYTILGAANLDDTFLPLFSGNNLFGLAPVFSRSGSELLVNFEGSSTGPLLQNIGGPWTPVTADFLVSGEVQTGAPADNNTVNSLIFDPDGRLQVHNTLTVTSGRFDVGTGRGAIRGGNVWTPGDFEKTGDGILDIESNVQMGGAAAIRNGRMYVNGRFAAPGGLTVFQNSLLGGNGVIVGNVFNNGTVAPGNSPGTTTVVGNYTQSSGGNLEIEVASLSLFDRLVVSGSANLAGTLKVINYGGNQLAYGQQYAFLQAAQINGDFDQILMPDPGRFRGRFWVNGGTGTLIVAPTSYTLVAVTRNQRNVAAALDSYIPARGDDRETVSIALDMLGEEQYPAAFDQIAPTFHESVANIAIEQAFAQVQLLNQRMSSVRLGTRAFQTAGIEAEPLVYDKGGKKVVDPKDVKTVIEEDEAPKWSLWTQGNGMFAKTTSVNQVPGYRTDGGGVLFGADYTFGDATLSNGKPALTTGFFGGYQGLYAKYDGGGNTTMNSAMFGSYASFTKGGFYADGVVSGGYNNFNVRRPIKFSTIDRTARSLQDSGQFAAALNLGHDWEVGKFTLGPILGAQYTYVGIAPFTERGADSLDLRLTQQNANSLRTTLGGRIAYTWKLSETVAIIPEGRMFWLHEFMNNPRAIGATLDGGAGPGFNYMTAEPYRDSVFCGAGVTTQFGENLTASAYWNIDFGRPDYLGQAVSLNLGWKF